MWWRRSKLPADLTPALSRDERVLAWAGAGHSIYIVGSEQQVRQWDGVAGGTTQIVTRVKLPNGLKLVMMPKKTRGGVTVAVMSVRFGDEKALFGKGPTGFYTGRLLMRGTRNKTRQPAYPATLACGPIPRLRADPVMLPMAPRACSDPRA